jgi:hypothetical protein
VQFLAPLFLAGAALIALPIVLHLLRRDVAPEIPFPAVRLLRRSPVDRSRSRRLRDLLLLLARIAALLLLAASFARPYRAGAAGTSPLTIVALDRSFSMAAPGQFARARQIARQEIDAASGRVALVAFGDRADVVSAPGLAADARAALDRVAPTEGATRYAALFETAAELAAEEPQARLVVVSDLQESGVEGGQPSLPRDITLVARDTGGPAANLAVTDLIVEAGSATAVVRNYGAAAASTAVAFTADDAKIGVRQVTIPPGEAAQVSIPARGEVMRAEIEDASGYPADNQRFAVRASARLPRVLLVTGGPGSSKGFYLSRALLAGGDGGADFDVQALTGPAFASLSPDTMASAAAVVLLSTHGIDRRAGEGLQALLARGGGVLVVAAPEVDPSVLSALFDWNPALSVTDASEAGVLTVRDGRHPIFQPFDGLAANLGRTVFQQAWRVDPGREWQPVASFSGGAAALLERRQGSGRVLLFTSDLDRRWNDFPLAASFVPFAQETLRYLAGPAAPAGPLLVSDVPAGVPATAGVVRGAGGVRAVNVDARESSPARLSATDFEAAISRTVRPASAGPARRARETEARQGLWRYGLALMLGTLVVEALVGSR